MFLGLGINLASSAVGAAASSFEPDQVDSIVGWWDADDIAIADGAEIASWTDRIGAVIATAQGVTTKPLYQTNEFNGHSVVQFVTTNEVQTEGDHFTLPNTFLNGQSAASAFMVFNKTLDFPVNFSDGAMFDGFHNDATGSRNSHQPYQDGVIYEHFGTSARKTTVDPTPVLTSARIYSVHSAASDFRTYLDGTQLFSTGTNTVQTGTGTNTKKFGNTSAGTGVKGKLACILFFNAALSTQDRQKVEGYLAHRYGLAANLPGDHPYKDAAP